MSEEHFIRLGKLWSMVGMSTLQRFCDCALSGIQDLVKAAGPEPHYTAPQAKTRC